MLLIQVVYRICPHALFRLFTRSHSIRHSGDVQRRPIKRAPDSYKEETSKRKRNLIMDETYVIIIIAALLVGLISYYNAVDTNTTNTIKEDKTDKNVDMTTERVDMNTNKRVDITTDKPVDMTTDKRVDMTTERVDINTNKRVDITTDKPVDMTTDKRVDIGNMRQELIQCKASMTQIKQHFNSLQNNFTQTQEKVEQLTKVINVSIKNAREDFLHLKRDMKILNGMQEIQDHRYITYSETAYLLLVGLILEPLIICLIVYKYFPWRNGIHGSQG